MRPLAHIGIKEQTYFTLLMGCLANTVESKQGDPATEFVHVHEKGIVNYGNRLYCTYFENGQAEHNYGSTTIYSKYFIDYRRFLQRPYYFAQQASTEKFSEEDVYIVELDISKFYDKVSREKLVSKIEKLMEEQGTSKDDTKNVRKLLKNFKNWQWTEQAKSDYSVCPKQDEKSDIKSGELKNDGIPQGLVAGGFLANIYLLDFDRKISELLKNSVENTQFKLIDYCRYVDDIRLVVTANKNFKKKEIKQLIQEYLQNAFDKNYSELKLNTDKTKITPYRGKPKGISTQVESIDQRASGPMGQESIDELINELEALLVLSGTENAKQDKESCHVNRLAEIESSTFDLREDTLRRFATNKLAKALNEKRHFTSRDVNDEGNPVAGEWDYLQERIARRLIAVWSKDPSLVLLLKKGLELFPSPRVLEPVLEQFEVVFKREDAQQKAIMRYCLAEIFRHSATVIHKKDQQAIPAHADVSAYFELLQSKAVSILIVSEGKAGG